MKRLIMTALIAYLPLCGGLIRLTKVVCDFSRRAVSNVMKAVDSDQNLPPAGNPAPTLRKRFAL